MESETTNFWFLFIYILFLLLVRIHNGPKNLLENAQNHKSYTSQKDIVRYKRIKQIKQGWLIVIEMQISLHDAIHWNSDNRQSFKVTDTGKYTKQPQKTSQNLQMLNFSNYLAT